MLKFLIKYIIIYIHPATKRERKREREERKKEGKEREIFLYIHLSLRVFLIYTQKILYIASRIISFWDMELKATSA